jgi:uncharacterized protein YcbK (DUF882 family)
MKGRTANLHPDLKAKLMELEARLAMEITITSGYRDPEHNKDVGGVDGSEHTYDPAQGADILCLRSVTRFKMLRELFDMGISRIGIGKDFIHVGIATDKPQHVCWTYYPTKEGAV